MIKKKLNKHSFYLQQNQYTINFLLVMSVFAWFFCSICPTNFFHKAIADFCDWGLALNYTAVRQRFLGAKARELYIDFNDATI